MLSHSRLGTLSLSLSLTVVQRDPGVQSGFPGLGIVEAAHFISHFLDFVVKLAFSELPGLSIEVWTY